MVTAKAAIPADPSLSPQSGHNERNAVISQRVPACIKDNIVPPDSRSAAKALQSEGLPNAAGFRR
jgi:hypothetical protein